MRRIIHGSTRGLTDARAFVRRLGGRDAALDVAPFVPGRDLVVTRAPGRLSLFGGVTDHAGAPALHLPASHAVFVALQRHPDRHVHMVRLRADSPALEASFDLPLAHLEAGGRPVSYAVARAYFARHPDRAWAAGIAGALLVLMRERGVRFGEGLRVLVAPSFPAGRGLGSAAAIRAAAVRAICAESNLALDAGDLVDICELVERFVVGAGSTRADQITAACGEPWHLVACSPQAPDTGRLVPWPSDLGIWGLDSGVAIGRGDWPYVATRVGASLAYRMIAEIASLAIERVRPGRVAIDDPIWRGHLANLPAEQFDEEFADQLPDTIEGAQFLARYGGVADPQVTVNPRTTYPVRAAAAHAVHERTRTLEFEAFLGMYPSPDRAGHLGELLRRSHESYVACGLVHPDAQAIVDLVTNRGAGVGLLGAKVTGSGGGGTVAVLGAADARPGLDILRQHLMARFGALPAVYGGSSPGAMAFGHLRLRGT